MKLLWAIKRMRSYRHPKTQYNNQILVFLQFSTFSAHNAENNHNVNKNQNVNFFWYSDST